MIIKKKRVIALGAVCVAFFAIFLFLERPVNIAKEVEATVYTVDGGEVTTRILIDGEKSEDLFTEEAEYTGIFRIDWYEPSCREGTDTRIVWYDDQAQSIHFMQMGTISNLEIENISINKTMDNIEIVLLDGTIISTDGASH